jgi:hypothetical protein
LIESSGYRYGNGRTASDSVGEYWLNKTKEAEMTTGTGTTSKLLNNSAYTNIIKLEHATDQEFLKLFKLEKWKKEGAYATMQAAISTIEQEFDDGAAAHYKPNLPLGDNDPGQDAKWLKSRFRRKLDDFGPDKVKGLLYIESQDAADNSVVNDIIAIRRAKDDISKTFAKNQKVEKWSVATLITVMTQEEIGGNFRDSYDYILEHPRALADPNDTDIWEEGLSNPDKGTFYPAYNPNVLEFARAQGMPVYQVLNILMEQDGKKHRFAPDKEALISWKTDTDSPKGFVSKRNGPGIDDFCTAKAQNCYPMSHQSRAYHDNGEDGPTYFLSSNGIAQNFDDEGNLRVSNFSSYIGNGGLYHLPTGSTPSMIINSFNLHRSPFMPAGGK